MYDTTDLSSTHSTVPKLPTQCAVQCVCVMVMHKNE